MGRASYINDNFLTVEESPPFMAEFFKNLSGKLFTESLSLTAFRARI